MSASNSEPGRDLLAARLSDAAEKRRRGEVARLSFLTPRERREAERWLERGGLAAEAWFWGGYPDAERTCLFLLPDYLADCLTGEGRDRNAEMADLLGEGLDEAVTAFRIRGSGYRVLSHRDYLGSLLGLGLERDAIGDIALQNDCEAVLFCSRKMAEFLGEHLERVASDCVKCEICRLDDGFTDGRRYSPIRDTVASPRLDAVVAALTNLSREAAREAVLGGLVEVDFEPAVRTDLLLTPPATLSIRGFGRYILRSFDGETKKGRLRLIADRMI